MRIHAYRRRTTERARKPRLRRRSARDTGVFLDGRPRNRTWRCSLETILNGRARRGLAAPRQAGLLRSASCERGGALGSVRARSEQPDEGVEELVQLACAGHARQAVDKV